MMNFQAQQVNSWQIMYTQLLNQYTALAHNYHQQTETNNSLYKELEQALEEKISLLQGTVSPLPTQPSLTLIHPHEEVGQLPGAAARGRGKKVRRHRNCIRRNGQTYKCRYSNCPHAYHSLMSMKHHIKTQHGGAIKKERDPCRRKDIL